jgi:hypothetical protein
MARGLFVILAVICVVALVGVRSHVEAAAGAPSAGCSAELQPLSLDRQNPFTRRYDSFYPIEADRQGRVWAAGDRIHRGANHPLVGLWDGRRWREREFWRIRGTFQEVAVTPEGEMWAVGNAGLVVHGKSLRSLKVERLPKTRNERGWVAATADGHVWVGTGSALYERLASGKWDQVSDASRVYRGPKGRLWSIGWDKTSPINRWTGTTMQKTATPRLHDPDLNGIAVAPDGDALAYGAEFWLDSRRMRPLVLSWTGERWVRAAAPPLTRPGEIQALAWSSPTNVWATVMYWGGEYHLFHRDANGWKEVQPASPTSGTVTTNGNLALAPSGDLWIASGGVTRLRCR